MNQQIAIYKDERKSKNGSPTNKTFSATRTTSLFEVPQHYTKPRAKPQQSIIKKTPDRFKWSRKMVVNENVWSKLKPLPHGITNFDPRYFKNIQTRTIRKSESFHRHSYINDLKNNLRENIMTGFQCEEMYRIDELHKTEIQQIRRISKEFHDVKHMFEMFVDSDHTESMSLMTQSTAEAKETHELRRKLAVKQQELGVIQNSIFSLEETFNKYKRCTAFIISITHKQFKQGRVSIGSQDATRKSMDTFDLIERTIKNERRHKNKPKLYFTNPLQIYELLKELESQNIKLMDQKINFEHTIIEEKSFLDTLTAYFNYQNLNQVTKLERVEKAISNLEKRTKYLKERSKMLIRSELRDKIAGQESILLHMYIEKAHSLLFEYPIGTESSQDMLTAIQNEYRHLASQVDHITSADFFPMQKKVQKTEKQTTKAAKVAKRALADLDILTTRVMKLLDEPYAPSRRKLMARSFVPPIRKQKLKVKEELTDETLLYQHLFTEQCFPNTKLIDNLEKVK